MYNGTLAEVVISLVIEPMGIPFHLLSNITQLIKNIEILNIFKNVVFFDFN